jgi:hypothetical protein
MRTATVRTAFLLFLACLLDGPNRSRAQCQAWNPAFGMPGPSGTVLALTVFDGGGGPTLCAGGTFSAVEGLPASRIAAWNGATWSAMGSGVAGPGVPAVNALAVFDDGSGAALYAGGYFSSAGDQPASHIAKWSGSTWSALGGGVNNEVYALRVYDDGSGPALYAGGSFTSAGGVAANHVAKWNGSSWSALGSGANGNVRALHAFDSGTGPALFVGGTFTSAGGVGAKHIAQWNGSAWSVLGTGANDAVLALTDFDDGSGSALYAGGYFLAAGGSSASNIAKWNGSTWSALGTGVDADVLTLCAYDDGSGPALYAGGWFKQAGALQANHIAKWNGSSWSMPGAWPGSPFLVNALTSFGSGSRQTLCAGLSVQLAGPLTADTLPLYLAHWNGAVWTPIGNAGGLNSEVAALAVCKEGSKRALYAGGSFTTAGGVSAKRIAKWNGSAWSALGSGMNNAVTALAAFDDGDGLVPHAGGTFTLAGGVSANHVAKWNGASWSALGSGVDGAVSALQVYDYGAGAALHVGGSFSSAGGLSASNIARWDGSTWSALGSGVNGAVLALTAFDDGSGRALYVGGSFSLAGGASANRVARWNGSTWSALGSGVTGAYVLALVGYDDGTGPALYAGGHFTSVGGVTAYKLGKWDGSNWSKASSGSTPWSSISNTVTALRVFDDGTGSALYVGDASLTDLDSAKLHKWNGTTWSLIGSLSVGSVSALAGYDGTSFSGADLYVGGSFHSQGWNMAQWLGCSSP